MRIALPRWIAHRGGGALAPENTLAGIRLAARMGFRAVEFDVMLSADGTPVLIHDETLERTTNGCGQVSETADCELFALDAGAGERIPRFIDAARLCRELGLLANVEIKPAAGHEQATAETVVRMAADVWRHAPEQVLLSSFALDTLVVARDLAPDLPRSPLFELVPGDWWRIFEQLQGTALHCDALGVSDAVLAEAAEQGVPVLCYTVNDAAQAAILLGRGVSGFFTDRLDRFADQARC
ncbi:MAG: glycerophosphodiester phosphodiesterase [Dechloromonas sp.]|nr:MAG: glycerophosphodiester phosphodiesterase [Dechloromonas sp.]